MNTRHARRIRHGINLARAVNTLGLLNKFDPVDASPLTEKAFRRERINLRQGPHPQSDGGITVTTLRGTWFDHWGPEPASMWTFLLQGPHLDPMPDWDKNGTRFFATEAEARTAGTETARAFLNRMSELTHP